MFNQKTRIVCFGITLVVLLSGSTDLYGQNSGTRPDVIWGGNNGSTTSGLPNAEPTYSDIVWGTLFELGLEEFHGNFVDEDGEPIEEEIEEFYLIRPTIVDTWEDWLNQWWNNQLEEAEEFVDLLMWIWLHPSGA